MIKLTNKYESELKEKFSCIEPFEEKYKYYYMSSYYEVDSFTANTSEWSEIERVSIHDGKVLAYFSVRLSQPEFYGSSFRLISFTEENKIIIMRDLLRFIDLLFIDYKINKLKWTVTVGNPAEKLYNTFIERYNGRVVGVFKDEVMLQDRNLYDVKHYEILRDDYMLSRLGK